MILISRKHLVVSALLLTACRQAVSPADSSGITQRQFIETYVALYAARDTARSAVEFDAQKRQIFARTRVTQESLTRFAAEHGGDVAYMAAVWDSIKTRLDHASEAIPK
jgi:hypothetical protein